MYATKSATKSEEEAIISSNLETLSDEVDTEPSLQSSKPEKFAIAPMVDVTDTHFRHFIRSFSQESYLYTAMIHENSILHGDRDSLLKFTEK